MTDKPKPPAKPIVENYVPNVQKNYIPPGKNVNSSYKPTTGQSPSSPPPSPKKK